MRLLVFATIAVVDVDPLFIGGVVVLDWSHRFPTLGEATVDSLATEDGLTGHRGASHSVRVHRLAEGFHGRLLHGEGAVESLLLGNRAVLVGK